MFLKSFKRNTKNQFNHWHDSIKKGEKKSYFFSPYWIFLCEFYCLYWLIINKIRRLIIFLHCCYHGHCCRPWPAAPDGYTFYSVSQEKIMDEMDEEARRARDQGSKTGANWWPAAASHRQTVFTEVTSRTTDSSCSGFWLAATARSWLAGNGEDWPQPCHSAP